MSRGGVLFVHGAFCGGWVFEAFAAPFRQAGVATRAPDLPGHAETDAADAVAGLSMRGYAEAVAADARTFDEPPVLIGHSMGGLVALMAAARAPTAGVVLLAPSPPWGVSGSTMEEAVSALSLYALGPFWTQSVAPEYASFGRFAVDRLPRARRRALFERLRPESGLALFETLNWWLDPWMTTSVRAGAIRAPILALAGERDVVHPPATVGQTALRLGGKLEILPQMSHWLPAEPGWRDVAKRCLAFIESTAALRVAAE
jgi:pimeloyl-ACP methyl ester carboxylesterase